MTTNEKYKIELAPYFLAKNEESCDLSANHLYGKFLNYIENQNLKLLIFYIDFNNIKK